MKSKMYLAVLEIFFIVLATAAFSYIASQEEFPSDFEQGESKVISAARNAFISYFGANLVSAEEIGFYTCGVDKQGAICQEYPAQVCDSQCSTSCFPGSRENFAECALGTCINSESGTCAANSPKSLCMSNGGIWNPGIPSEIAECKPGCCVLGDQTSFVSSKTCNILSAQRGLQAVFKPEITTELECSLLSKPNEEGACVVLDVKTAENTCKFGTKSACQTLNGAFYSQTLCSAPELKTTCQKQASTGCVDGKNEVYWFDSCGNRENIFDANKVKSWNNGKILSKSDSCALGTTGNPLLKQATCGNCDYIGGSICGAKIGAQKASFGDYVCRDLSCVDEQGNKRKQGESWCAFNSKIGVDGEGNGARTVDVPGSRHFRESCLNGEVITDPCQDFRNEVCYENKDAKTGFSSAACRVNQWQTCIEANTDPAKLDKCEENPDCVLKSVDIDTQFKFNRCVPRYPPGFDSSEGNGDASTICGLGSQVCTYQSTKKLFGGKKKVNANCGTPEFTETMNNLCISLGDCGAKVNIAGDYSDQGYSVSGAPPIDKESTYVKALEAFSGLHFNQFVVQGTGAGLLDQLGLAQKISDNMDAIGSIAGAAGIGLAYLASSGIIGSGGTFFSYEVVGENFVGPLGSNQAIAPGLNAAGGAIVGAAIGAAATTFLIKYAGIAPGLSPAETTALIALGAGAGAALGYAYMAGILFTTGWVPVVGWIAAAVVLAVIAYAFFTGVGKTKTTQITFSCLPWQAPRGGDKCGECGKDGLPCSKYACQSLGQTCEFINEGTDQEACVNISPNDVNSPVITPDSSVLRDGFSYQTLENGYVLKGPGTEGCLPAYSSAGLGIVLDEPGQCKFDIVHTQKYDDMTGGNFDVLNSNSYTKNHALVYQVPSLDLLSSDPDSTINPNVTNNFALYVRCIDKSGNSNVNEYAISFCVAPEIDRTPPIISSFSPASDGSVAIDATEKEISLVTNEPAECKWSTTDQDYDLMSNDAECNYEAGEGTIFGWMCSAKLPISAETNNYYFRCKDQPWLSGTETDGRARNANTQSTPYSLKKTITPLAIESVYPNGDLLTSASTPVNVDLKVTTAGGADGVARYCDFAMKDGGLFTKFYGSVGTDEHTQNGLKFFIPRKYELPIKCYDDAGNTATSKISFDVFIDNKGPLISRVYYASSSGLNVITNEKSSCAISTESCGFDFAASASTLMTGAEFTHTSALNKGSTVYVKCKDDFGNIGACMTIRKGIL